MTYMPSPILTMTTYSGETHVDRETRLSQENHARLMLFITSPEVREAVRVMVGDEIDRELDRVGAKAREFASHYPIGADGRNTFTLFAEWVERRQKDAKS